MFEIKLYDVKCVVSTAVHTVQYTANLQRSLRNMWIGSAYCYICSSIWSRTSKQCTQIRRMFRPMGCKTFAELRLNENQTARISHSRIAQLVEERDQSMVMTMRSVVFSG